MKNWLLEFDYELLPPPQTDYPALLVGIQLEKAKERDDVNARGSKHYPLEIYRGLQGVMTIKGREQGKKLLSMPFKAGDKIKVAHDKFRGVLEVELTHGPKILVHTDGMFFLPEGVLLPKEKV